MSYLFSVVENLRSFANNQAIQTVPVDVHELLTNVLELKEHDLKMSTIQVQQELAQDLPKILGDAGQLQAVFLNLINNAQSAIAEAHDRGVIWIKAARRGDNVRITVADDGRGIKPEHLGKVFDPFFTTKDIGGEMGMGLSICHGIVARHGGTIWVESEYGKGATFYLEFPTAQDTPVEQTDGPAAEPATAPMATRILVVDDEEMTRRLLAVALGRRGHDVTLCEDAREALELLNEVSFDLVLLDVKMPDMDGREFFQVLANRAPDLASRVVIVTGDTVSASTQEFLRTTGRPVLTKPFELDTLEKLVAEELGKRPRWPGRCFPSGGPIRPAALRALASRSRQRTGGRANDDLGLTAVMASQPVRTRLPHTRR